MDKITLKIENIAKVNNITLGGLNTISPITVEVSRKKENPHPSTTNVSRGVKMITYLNKNQIVDEDYIIQPSFTGLMPCPDEDTVWYLKIPNSVYAMKFYGPDKYSDKEWNTTYCVPAIKDDSYNTGYRDYTTGIPQEFINAFVRYATKDKTFTSDKAKYTVEFSFSFWGNVTGALNQSSAFTFEIEFYPGQTPDK